MKQLNKKFKESKLYALKCMKSGLYYSDLKKKLVKDELIMSFYDTEKEAMNYIKKFNLLKKYPNLQIVNY